MSWVDDVMPYLQQYGGAYPLDFLLGWIQQEAGGKITSTTSLGEAGFFQIYPETARDLGIDITRVKTDPAYSVSAGIQMLDYYRRATDTGVWPEGSQAYYGAIKLRHAVPAIASAATTAMRGAGVQFTEWPDAADWIETNLPSFVSGHSFSHWVDNVSAVFRRGAALASGLPPLVASIAGTVGDPPVAGLLVAVGIGLWLYYRRR